MSVIDQGGLFSIGGETVVHRLAYGALHLLDAGYDAFGPPTKGVDATTVLRRAVDLGIDLIDTADVYGPNINEEQIATALYPYPPHLTIGTKGGLQRTAPGVLTPNSDPGHLRSAIEGSLRRLKRDHIEIWSLHHIDDSLRLEDIAGTLADLRHEGKVRHVGLSKASVEQLEQVRSIVPIATVQNLYNVTDRRDDAVVDYCDRNGIGFMAFFPLAKGRRDLLTICCGAAAAKYGVSVQQIALAWLLHRSPSIIPIPGTALAAELEANVAACAIRLDVGDLDLIDLNQKRLPAPAAQGSSVIRPRAVKS